MNLLFLPKSASVSFLVRRLMGALAGVLIGVGAMGAGLRERRVGAILSRLARRYSGKWYAASS